MHKRSILIVWFLLILACAGACLAATGQTGGAHSQSVRNLEAFARLYGVLRWFHPSDENLEADWDAVAIAGVEMMQTATDDSKLILALEALFSPIAPTMRLAANDDLPDIPNALLPPDPPESGYSYVYAWEHEGVGSVWSTEVMRSLYSSDRNRFVFRGDTIPRRLTPPQEPFLLDLGENLYASVPVTLYGDAYGTFPHDASEISSPSASESPDPVSLMLADAVVIWNVMQHFYPYFDVVDIDWETVLEHALRNILETGPTYSLEDLEADLLVPLRDGHGWIDPSPSSSPVEIPDMTLAWIDDELVIASAGDHSAAAGIHSGDVIVQIDGIEASVVFLDAMRNISGSLHLRQSVATRLVLSGPEGTSVTLDVQPIHGNEMHTVTVERTETPRYAAADALDPIAQLEPGIYYVDVGRAKTEQLKAAQPDLARARGIIIDARGYIASLWSMYFTDCPLTAMQLRIPCTSLPNQIDVTYDIPPVSMVPAGSFSSDCELVFLINAQAMSAAEHHLSYFVRAGIGTRVGTPTGGANGNVNRLLLPSGNRVTWTGMIAEWADRSLFHTVGIQPDIHVERTRQGLAEGRDEQLEEALRVLKEKLGEI